MRKSIIIAASLVLALAGIAVADTDGKNEVSTLRPDAYVQNVVDGVIFLQNFTGGTGVARDRGIESPGDSGAGAAGSAGDSGSGASSGNGTSGDSR